MSILHVIVAVLAAIYIYAPEDRRGQKYLYCFLCCVVLFCSCYRTMVKGYDTETYIEYFHMFRSLSWSESLQWGFEPGYIILNKIIGCFTEKSQVFLAVLSIITLVPIFCLIWRKSNNAILSLFVFVAVGNLFSSYAALRQWCAVAIMVLGYDFIIKRRLIPFLLTVVMASTFHQTAFFFVPLYFVYPMRMTRLKLLLSMALAIGMLVFTKPIMSILDYFAKNETLYVQNGGYVQLFTYWALAMIIDIFAYPVENEKNTRLNYYALLYSAVMQPLCLAFGGFARIHLYTWFSFVLCIPRLAQYMARDYDQKNCFLMKLVVAAVMVLWFLITQDASGLTLVFL